jgi:hypothetical protein
MKIKPKNPLAFLLGLTLNLGVSGIAHAALQGRSLDSNLATVEAYYDTDLNITWLADANYAQTSEKGYAWKTMGKMSWLNAHLFARDLRFFDDVNLITYDNWRLPTATHHNGDWACTGINCTDSEMGYLFYVELGGEAFKSIHTTHNANYNLFSNIQPSDMPYWLDVGDETYNKAAYFNMRSGQQDGNYIQDNLFYAWAVSDGDVGIATAVPEASTYAMMLAGLALVGVATRRQRT